MFKFLKDKLKKAVDVFSKSVKEEIREETVPVEEKKKVNEAEQKQLQKKKETEKGKKVKAAKTKTGSAETDAEEEFLNDIAKELEEEGLSAREIESDIEDEIEQKEIEQRKTENGVVELPEDGQKIKQNIEVKNKKGFFSKLREIFTEKEKDFEKDEEDLEEEIEEEKDEESKLKDKSGSADKSKSSSEEKIAEKEIELEKSIEKREKIKEVERTLPKDKERYSDEEEPKKETSKETSGFFSKFKEVITHKKLSEDKFNDLFWNLEIALLENNVAVEVIEKIKDDLKEELVDEKIRRFGVDGVIAKSLKKSIDELFDVEKIDLIKKIKTRNREKPFVISFIGINGSGKTTTLAKIAHLFKKNGISCVIAASDTFRVAAIEQLEEHAKKLDIKMIKQDYNADSAAVAFDAIQHAKSRGIDAVLIDTAGRMQSNANLMEELKKITRVAKPDMNIFIGDSVTGNDAVEQAKDFDEWIGIDGIVLAKADVDEKGGCAISISYVTKKPIIYIGTGQTYDDLKEFDSSVVLENLGLV